MKLGEAQKSYHMLEEINSNILKKVNFDEEDDDDFILSIIKIMSEYPLDIQRAWWYGSFAAIPGKLYDKHYAFYGISKDSFCLQKPMWLLDVYYKMKKGYTELSGGIISVDGETIDHLEDGDIIYIPEIRRYVFKFEYYLE